MIISFKLLSADAFASLINLFTKIIKGCVFFVEKKGNEFKGRQNEMEKRTRHVTSGECKV